MKISNLLQKSALVVGFFYLTLGHLAAEGENLPVDPNQVQALRIDWPDAPRPALTGNTIQKMVDGMWTRDIVAKDDNIFIRIPEMPGWKIVSRSPRDSFVLGKRIGDDEVRVSFTFFRSNEFLKDNQMPSLMGYVDLLKRETYNRAKILNEDVAFMVPRSFFILDATYRLIDWELEAKGEVTAYKDYIIFPQSDAYPCALVRVQGPKEMVDSLMPEIISSLRFTYIVPEDRQDEFKG